VHFLLERGSAVRERLGTLGLLTVLIALLTAPAATAEKWSEWKTAHDRDGLKLETRKHGVTGVLQTRATAVLGCPSDELWELLIRENSFLRIMPDMQESVRVKATEGRNEEWWYQRVSRPPISDRDYTLYVQWTVEETALGSRYHRVWSVDNDNGPAPQEKVLRLHVNNGSWLLTPAEGGKTGFEYLNYVELEGSLWRIITNRAARSNAIEFLENLRRECSGQ
jgi:hypothetical protein